MSTNLNKNIIQGSDVMVWLLPDGTESAGKGSVIGFSTNLSLNLSANTTEVSNKDFGNGWTSSIVTGRSWTASCDAMYASSVYGTEYTYDSLFECYVNGTPIKLTFGVSQNAGATERTPNVDDATGWVESGASYAGLAVITSLELTGNNGDAATYSVEFTGAGAIAKD